MSSIAKQNTKAKIAELADGLLSLETKLREIGRDLRKVAGRKRNTTSDSTESDEPKVKNRSAWQDWNSECTKRFAEDYAAHLAEVGKKSDAITFASKCRSSTHKGEWEEYLATWNAAHPKVEKPKKSVKSKAKAIVEVVPETVESADEALITSSSSSASPLPTASPAPPVAKKAKARAKASSDSSDDEAPVKKRPAKKASASSDSESDTASAKKTRVVKNAAIDSSDDEGSVKKAKKPNKAELKAKAIEASVAASIAEPPTPWKYRGKDYLKNESNQVWTAGPEGELGTWVGTFDGKKLDKSDGPTA